jgi:hypothetical protein
MREFRSLNPKRLPKDFDAEELGEQPIVDMKETRGRIVVSFIFPGFYISDHVRIIGGQKIIFKQVNIGGTSWITESGRPLLPSFGRYVQIPPGCTFSISWTTNRKPIVFDDVLVYPSQTMLTDAVNEEDEFEYDKEFYRKTAAYPKKIVGKRGPLEVDEYASLLLNVCPFRYFPSKRMLEGYGNITVTITLKAKKEAATISPNDATTNTMASGNLFVNPVRRVEERVLPGGRVVLPPLKPRGPEFIIIYHDTFKKAAERLEKWKETRGLRTETVSINDIGNDIGKKPADIEPADIKNYIRSRRIHFLSRLRYVLLFGDVDHIVTEVIHGNATDYYYATKDNPKGDNYELPWLAIGRIPVKTPDEGEQVVDQIIRYEKTPPVDQDYYDRMVFAAFFQDNNADGWADMAYTQTMEKIRQHMLTIGFDIDRIYVTNSPNPQFYIDGTPVPSDVISAMMSGATATTNLVDATSEGQLIIGHRGHGRSHGWRDPSFKKADLDGVSGKVPTVFYSLNCHTGRFDLTDGTESFAEKILRIDAGAPSLIACTRASNTWLNNYLMKALFDAMWGNMLPTFPGPNVSYPVRKNRLGDILNYGKTYLPLQVGTYPSVVTSTVQDHLEIYHVVGDPTLEIWKEEPKRSRIWATLWNSQIYIRLSHCPADAVITIWAGDRLIKRTEPLSTTLMISLRSISDPVLPVRKRIKVCFWAPGYRFVEVVPKSSPFRPR